MLCFFTSVKLIFVFLPLSLSLQVGHSAFFEVIWDVFTNLKTPRGPWCPDTYLVVSILSKAQLNPCVFLSLVSLVSNMSSMSSKCVRKLIPFICQRLFQATIPCHSEVSEINLVIKGTSNSLLAKKHQAEIISEFCGTLIWKVMLD